MPTPFTVLVVGATGSVGRHVVQVALRRGDRVVALARASSRRVVPDGAEVLLTDVTTGGLGLPPVDGVVMTHGSHGGAQEAETVDYGAVVNVLDGLGDQRPHVALMTSIGVTGHAQYAPHLWKRRGERVLRASGLPYTIVRPGWFDDDDADQQRVVMLQGDRRQAGGPQDGVIARQAIAEVLVAAVHSPEADRRTFELVAEHGSRQEDLGALFAALAPDPAGALDGVLDLDVVPVDEEPPGVRERLR